MPGLGGVAHRTGRADMIGAARAWLRPAGHLIKLACARRSNWAGPPRYGAILG